MSPSALTRDEWARRLAQALVGTGALSESAVQPAIDEAVATGASLAAVLIAHQLVPRDVVLHVASQLSQLPVVDLDTDPPSEEAQMAVPPGVAREYGVVGFRAQGEQLAVAFGEPPTPDDVRALSALVGYVVVPVLADPLAVARHAEQARAALAGAVDGSADPAAGRAPDGSRAGDRSPTSVTALPAGNGSVPAGAAGTGPGGAGASPTDIGAPAAGVGAVAPAGGLRVGADAGAHDGSLPLHIDDLLRYAVSVGASDLHLTTAMPPCIRLHGAIRPIEGSPRLSNEQIRDMIFGILPQAKREQFEAAKELDTSHSIPGVGRFRVNVFLQRGTVAAVLRAIPHEIPEFSSLGIPDAIRSFTDLRRGLVLVTGPTGSGKSTTLAALVDIINRTKPLHIITVEDPIEFLHNHKRSIVNQREVGQDTCSFAEALRRVLREDPDVILVGEMRDLETISMALTAAETGHLVFGTLHTQDAPQTIDRVIDVFPTNQQEQVRTMLAASLEGVVTQQLLVDTSGTGRLAACEVMVCTSAVRNLIRSNKTHQIYSLMQTGGQYGMQTMDQALARLVREGRVSEGVAFDRCRNEDDLRNHLAA
jgi:twitching motility protein PilT